jgi:hypothetical protein
VKVRLTGTAAWQMGGRGLGRTDWETVPCDCSLCQTGRFLAVDERRADPDPDQSPWRHINRANVHEYSAAGRILTNGERAFPPAEAGSISKKPVARMSRTR